jgi:hypothetical protein
MNYRRKLKQATVAKKMIGMLDDFRTNLRGMQVVRRRRPRWCIRYHKRQRIIQDIH